MVAWLDEVLARGQHAFCETRGPSLCAQQPGCRHASMRSARPDLFADADGLGLYSCCVKVTAAAVGEAQRQWERAASRPPGMFVHKLQE